MRLKARNHDANSGSDRGTSSHTRDGVCSSMPRPPPGRLRFALTLWVHADLGLGEGLGSQPKGKAAGPLVALQTDSNGRTAYVWQDQEV